MEKQQESKVKCCGYSSEIIGTLRDLSYYQWYKAAHTTTAYLGHSPCY